MISVSFSLSRSSLLKNRHLLKYKRIRKERNGGDGLKCWPIIISQQFLYLFRALCVFFRSQLINNIGYFPTSLSLFSDGKIKATETSENSFQENGLVQFRSYLCCLYREKHTCHICYSSVRKQKANDLYFQRFLWQCYALDGSTWRPEEPKQPSTRRRK